MTQDQFFNEIISKAQGIPGVDLIYFLDSNLQIIKEHKNTETDNYIEPVSNVIKLESLPDKIGTVFYSTSFHTYTLLNESGLIIISKISNLGLYIVIIAGENEPADLINLLKICKEARSGFSSFSKETVYE